MRTPRVQAPRSLLLLALLLTSTLLLSACGIGSRVAAGSHLSPGPGAGGAGGAPASASAGSGGTASSGLPSRKPGKPAASAGPRTGGPGEDSATPRVAVHTLRSVPVGATPRASLDSGVQVSVTGVQDITVKASGPGEVAGKAVAAKVRVRNTSKTVIDLGGFAVTASVAGDRPASPSDAKPAAPMSGELLAGHTAVGVYVFTVPGSDFSGLQIQVSSDTAADIAVFRR